MFIFKKIVKDFLYKYFVFFICVNTDFPTEMCIYLRL